jgi:hypothetical protein
MMDQSKGKLLLFVAVLAMVFLSAGCHRDEEEFLLRYTPRVGSTYRYTSKIGNLMEMTGEMQVLNEDESGYRIQFSGMRRTGLFSGSLIVSDRHNSSDPGYISLNFPDDPVGPGAEWGGEVPWYFENYYVLDSTQIWVPASYELLKVEQGEDGTYAVIEQKIEADVAVDGLVFHVGQVGVRWDGEGRITDVHPGYDAFGKLQVGDVVVGINGQRAGTTGELGSLAEKYIQHPKEGKTDVEKSIDKLAAVKIYNLRNLLTITYDIERGLLLSAEAIINHDVAFTSPTTDTFLVVDDYDGFSKFGYLRGHTAYQTHYGSDEVAWSLSLLSDE